MRLIERVLLLFCVISSFTEIFSLSIGSSVYVHIPFCRRRCYYCDFAVNIIGDRESTKEKESKAYADLICREIDATYQVICQNGYTTESLETIYFGGGTPSLMSLPGSPCQCLHHH